MSVQLYEKLYKVKGPLQEEEGPFSVDVVFSFDTTGSMSSVIQSVRQNLTDTVDRLFRTVEGIRIGIIVHGDYCDYPNMMWVLHPTKDVNTIKEFIRVSPDTSGGDYPECYELVLYAANRIPWKADVKVLVVIGDATPHNKGELHSNAIEHVVDQMQLQLDWKKLAEEAKENQITIFSCHALPEGNTESIDFYHSIATITGGYYFPLNKLQAFKDYMVAICLKAADSADILALLEKNKKELEDRLKEIEGLKAKASSAEELRMYEHESSTLMADATETGATIEVARTKGLFSSEAVASSTKYKSKRPTTLPATTRLERFESELKETEEGTATTFNILNDRIDRHSTPMRFRSSRSPHREHEDAVEEYSDTEEKNGDDDDDDDVVMFFGAKPVTPAIRAKASYKPVVPTPKPKLKPVEEGPEGEKSGTFASFSASAVTSAASSLASSVRNFFKKE